MELLSGCLKKIKSLHLLLTKYPQERFLNEKRVGTNQIASLCKIGEWVTNYTLLYLHVCTLQNS